MNEMVIRAIRTDHDYREALAAIDRLIDAPEGSRELELLEVLSVLVADYEDRHHPIEPPDPVALIEFVMESRGLTRKDLEPFIGSRTRVAEILNRRRHLSKLMIWRLCSGLGMPAQALLQPYELVPAEAAA